MLANKNTSRLTFMLICVKLMMLQSLCAWQPIISGSSNIPGHVYQVNCQAGNIVSGQVYWIGSGDLDLFVYRQNTNLMSQSSSAVYFDSASRDSRQVFSFQVNVAGNYYLRVKAYYLSSSLQYNINITVSTAPTVTYTNYISKLAYFMATARTNNIPVQNSYIPVMFTYVPNTGLSISMTMAFNQKKIKQFISGQTSCILNSDVTNYNATWDIIFNHSLNYIFLTSSQYNYQIKYNDDLSQCATFCQNGYIWDTETSTCIQNDEYTIINDSNQTIRIVLTVFGSLLTAFVLFCVIVLACRMRKASVSPQIRQQPIRQIQSMSEINMLDKNICAICLGQNCNVILPCLHVYHELCINQWYRKKNQCPNCRQIFNISQVKIKPKSYDQQSSSIIQAN